MSVNCKFDCYSSGVASALAELLVTQGWAAKVLGSAVLSNLPAPYANCFCGVLVKQSPPTPQDVTITLGQ